MAAVHQRRSRRHGMFWKRMTPTAGWTGLVSGTVSAVLVALRPAPRKRQRGGH